MRVIYKNRGEKIFKEFKRIRQEAIENMEEIDKVQMTRDELRHLNEYLKTGGLGGLPKISSLSVLFGVKIEEIWE